MTKTHVVSQLDVEEFERCMNLDIKKYEADGWKLKDIKFSTVFRYTANTPPLYSAILILEK